MFRSHQVLDRGNTYEVPDRTCYKCGAAFAAFSGRTKLCTRCRKPEKPVRERSNDLTFREKQICQLLVTKAASNKEIAAELRLTEGTIKEYLFRIFPKIGVNNRLGVALWAVQNPDKWKLKGENG